MMNTFEIEAIWKRLSSDLQSGHCMDSGYLRRRVCAESGRHIYLALSTVDGMRALLYDLPTKAVPTHITYPGSKGFQLFPVAIAPGPNGHTRFILKVLQPAYHDVFSVLVSDLIEHVSAQPTDPYGAGEFFSRLARWQTFFLNHPPDGLGIHQQLGLYGELWFLRHILLEHLGPSAMHAWTGPQGSNQDFQLAGGAVEVKSSRATTPDSIPISNIRQLDDTTLDFLVLCHSCFEARKENGQSLPEIVDEIRQRLGADDLVLRFSDLLMQAGYLDLHERHYQDTRYSFRWIHYYRVAPGFPRLLESDLSIGVSEVTYSIQTAACHQFSMSDLDVFDLMQGGGSL